MLRDVYVDALLERLDDKKYRDYAFEALKIFRAETCTLSDNNGIEIPFIDIYCQLPKNMELNFIDIIEASLAWQQILLGKLQYGFISIPDQAKKDADIEGNNSIISNLVNLYPGQIIEANFTGGNFGADGYIEFAKPPISKKTIFPLEVGYCKSDQIMTHIFQNQCFARFPYDYAFIVIFEDTEFKPFEIG
ncbi:hypothetical protein [Desulfoluna butyratoxydans]|uniref:Uncharacterized protein n=1 Tax=Desulfoluna butyratoxydans TaxID=231438 RepID=A0A4U8YP14_9BACT|nr:hypothetical protein [Desulfoluna butyratoxydans]VFQ45925.1 hypothetical protein MSL71_35880 [Desulfoluna butyratoxydans]